MSLRDQLLDVRARLGTITPETVLQAGTPKSSPLHHRFTWDNKVAGHRWRLHEAHELIQEARVVYQQPGKPSESQRAFRPVPREGGVIAYEPIEEIAQDPFARELVLREMQRQVQALWDRYKDLEEFVALMRELVA